MYTAAKIWSCNDAFAASDRSAPAPWPRAAGVPPFISPISAGIAPSAAAMSSRALGCCAIRASETAAFSALRLLNTSASISFFVRTSFPPKSFTGMLPARTILTSAGTPPHALGASAPPRTRASPSCGGTRLVSHSERWPYVSSAAYGSDSHASRAARSSPRSVGVNTIHTARAREGASRNVGIVPTTFCLHTRGIRPERSTP